MFLLYFELMYIFFYDPVIFGLLLCKCCVYIRFILFFYDCSPGFCWVLEYHTAVHQPKIEHERIFFFSSVFYSPTYIYIFFCFWYRFNYCKRWWKHEPNYMWPVFSFFFAWMLQKWRVRLEIFRCDRWVPLPWWSRGSPQRHPMDKWR